MKIILSLHPIIQATAILLAYYAAYLGVQRTRSLHFGQQVLFQRKQHAIIGAIALLTLLGGLFGGFIIADIAFPQKHGIGPHGMVALVMLPLLIIGIGTGYYLYVRPAKNKVLSVVHGVNNLLILLLLGFQVYSGWIIFGKVVLGDK